MHIKVNLGQVSNQDIIDVVDHVMTICEPQLLSINSDYLCRLLNQ